MRTFIENYLHFMKNCIRPPYEKLRSLKSGFIVNSNFENSRDPCIYIYSVFYFVGTLFGRQFPFFWTFSSGASWGVQNQKGCLSANGVPRPAWGLSQIFLSKKWNRMWGGYPPRMNWATFFCWPRYLGAVQKLAKLRILQPPSQSKTAKHLRPTRPNE